MSKEEGVKLPKLVQSINVYDDDSYGPNDVDIECIAFDRNFSKIVWDGSEYDRSGLHFMDLTTEEETMKTNVTVLEDKFNRNLSVAFHPTAPLMATGSNDNTAKLWRMSTDGKVPRCTATLEGHRGPVMSVAFHPRRHFLATGSGDKTAKLWRMSADGTAATCVATLAGHTNFVFSVAFHPSMPLLATGSWDKTAKLWSLSKDDAAARCVATLAGHSDHIFSVAFHESAPLLATGSLDKTAKVWSITPDGTAADGTVATCVATLAGHRGPVRSVAFHPTAPLLATGSWDNTAKLWSMLPDGTNATCVATLAEHSGPVISVAFRAHGPILATASADGTANFWNCAHMASDRMPVMPSDRLKTIAIGSDGGVGNIVGKLSKPNFPVKPSEVQLTQEEMMDMIMKRINNSKSRSKGPSKSPSKSRSKSRSKSPSKIKPVEIPSKSRGAGAGGSKRRKHRSKIITRKRK